jgi:hypothetical protein
MVKIKIDFTMSLLMKNSFNEVCNGFNVGNYYQIIGVSYEELCKIFMRFRDGFLRELVSRGKTINTELPKTDLTIIINVIKETYRELTDGYDEFFTRTGVENDEAKAIVEYLESKLQN